ncbi:MAG: nicotinate-nucleotide diphosphorylase (carboxylating), partial [Pseudomonadota bacterium]
EQADVAVSAGATSLLLDNMTPTMLRQAVQRFGGKIPLEASGGVTLDSIRAIAETGVDFVSVGTALTLSAAAIDIGMDYDT